MNFRQKFYAKNKMCMQKVCIKLQTFFVMIYNNKKLGIWSRDWQRLLHNHKKASKGEISGQCQQKRAEKSAEVEWRNSEGKGTITAWSTCKRKCLLRIFTHKMNKLNSVLQIHVGLMFGSKALIQLITNPLFVILYYCNNVL